MRELRMHAEQRKECESAPVETADVKPSAGGRVTTAVCLLVCVFMNTLT